MTKDDVIRKIVIKSNHFNTGKFVGNIWVPYVNEIELTQEEYNLLEEKITTFCGVKLVVI